MLKNYFKIPLKQIDGKPSIVEVEYVGSDGEKHIGLQFEGYASTKQIDRGQDVVLPEAFLEGMPTYMENSIVLLQHDHDKPVGNITKAIVDENGLYVIGICKIDTDNLYQKLRTGVIKTMSIGFRCNPEDVEQQTMDEKNVWVIKKLELYEISLVAVPMNPKAKLKADELQGLSDEEYAKYFDTNKNEQYSLTKSVKDAIKKMETIKEKSLSYDEIMEDDMIVFAEYTSGKMKEQIGKCLKKVNDKCVLMLYTEVEGKLQTNEEIYSYRKDEIVFLRKYGVVVVEEPVVFEEEGKTVEVEVEKQEEVKEEEQEVVTVDPLLETEEEKSKAIEYKEYLKALDEKSFEEERKEVYAKYKDETNMTASELQTWSENECSRKASLSRGPIKRNIRLLSKTQEEWTRKDVKDANRTISFLSRMKGAEQGENVSEECPYSKRDISMKNWAYDINKKQKDVISEESKGIGDDTACKCGQTEKQIGDEISTKKMDEMVTGHKQFVDTVENTIKQLKEEHEKQIKDMQDAIKDMFEYTKSIVGQLKAIKSQMDGHIVKSALEYELTPEKDTPKTKIGEIVKAYQESQN